jgi:1-acyl-sn-glycerol-3-phosphate acyltransferase
MGSTGTTRGYDDFGLDPVAVMRTESLVRPLYERYFHVTAHDPENLPGRGAAILVANHSGVLPVDAAMLWMDVLRHTDPPRVLRPIAHHFVPTLPLLGTFFAHAGVVDGTRANVARLLAAGELLAIWPEGVSGTGKKFRQRYELQDWNPGHARMALQHRVPIIPVAILGAEESWPLATRLDRLHPFGAPYLPVPWTPLPRPVRFDIYYGEPVLLHHELPAEAAHDPRVITMAADRTRQAVEELIGTSLALRGRR